MIVLDSSGWIEFLVGSDTGRQFIPAVRSPDLVVPSIVIVEVRRWWLSSPGKVGSLDDAMQLMARGHVAPLDMDLARSAGTLGIRHKLPLADSIVYATAQSLGAVVWTQDRDFEDLPGVEYIPKAGR